MTLRHHHHHHRHAGRQLRTSAESRRNSENGNADSEEDIAPTYEFGFAEHDPTSNSHLDPEVSVDETFLAPEVAEGAHDLGRRDEVTQTLTAVVATAFDVIIESGTQTIAQLTVTSLPAVVTVPSLGTVSIPAASSPPEPIATGPATVNPSDQIPLGTSSLSPSNPQLTSQVISPTQLTDSTVMPASSTTEVSSTPSIHVENIVSSTTILTSSALTGTSSSSTITTTPAASPSPLVSGETSTGTSQFSSTAILPPAGVSTESLSGASTTSIPSTLAGSAVSSSPSSTSSSASSAGGSSDVGKIVGGVVGGVSGLLIILLLAFLLFRWRARRAQTAGDIRGGSSRNINASSGPRSAEMASQRSSNTPLAASAVLGRWASSSSRRSGRRDEGHANSGERGFQKISGRKIPSVLHTGGDGYGDEIEEEHFSELRTPPLEATSPVSPTSAIGGGGNHRHAPMADDLIAAGIVAGGHNSTIVMRPSPARTPTASSVDLVAPSQASQRGVSPMRPDPLGRTLSRYDGSRGSRFTEGI